MEFIIDMHLYWGGIYGMHGRYIDGIHLPVKRSISKF
jgi:hypothetical protein